ncbi:Vps54-like protein-domain-containing protein [Exophiala viscosa]|uniref:Vps54-like protein-domain-containing protein n=1 Tax=Exophiala viscosa TaxID=2486360 RepID=UPI0021910D26|nr:Vps54-like protein-domain-containing protein [Exophiala viscosa]
MASPVRPRSEAAFSPTASSPLTGYPFPDVSQRQHGQRGTVRRGSTASSITSIGGALDTGSINHPTIAETSQNAISTLLQHPITRTGLQASTIVPSTGYKAPTQRDIPPVALTNIPHIEAKAFHPYLAQVGSLYEAFQRAKNEGEGEASLFHRGKKDTRNEEWEAILAKRLQRPHSRAGSVSSTLSTPLERPQPTRRQSGQRRQAVTPLSTIPTVYSEEEFHLENPRTFDIVSEHSEIVRDPNGAPSGRKSLATNAILQEKLSWYMDTVEVHLINSISTASKSFFSALGSLRELHGDAADSVDRIQRLRKELAKLDKEMAIDGLKVINLKQRRDNVRQLAQAIMQLEDIVKAVQSCEDMVESGEIDQALDGLDDLDALMAGRDSKPSESKAQERYQKRDLRKLKALQGASDDLNQIRYRAGRGYETRFHNSLLNDIRRHVDQTETSATLQRWGVAYTRPRPGQRRAPSSFPGYMNIGPELRAELEAEMKGLSRARYTTPAATTFRAIVLREMRNIIRKQLPSSTDDDNVSTVSASTAGGRTMSQQEKSSILARNLRALDADDWYQMLATIYTNLSEGLRRLSVQVKILLDITSNLPENILKSPPTSPDPSSLDRLRSPQAGRPRSTSSVQAEMQQVLDLSSLLGEGVDLAQAQITKVVKVRSQQNAELSLVDFLKFFTLNRLFTDECEAISGRSGTALRSVLDSQIKDFVARFGESQKHQVIKVMDSDKWDAKDFGDRENQLLQRIIDGSTSDALSWIESTMIWQSPTNGRKDTNGTATNGTSAPFKVRSAVVDEQRYILPESAIAMLQSMETFQHLAVGIPSMGQEVATLLLESLKLFNSRSSQLILGAGATRSAGLKNITTKHLALSSQGLSFIVALIPYVREFFRRHIPSSTASQIMTEFDKVKRFFQEHQNSIHEKLVDIMSGRASMHVKAMKGIDWEEAAKNKSVSVSPYMETLTKETATLQKVLAKHLPDPVVAGIMIPVFASYREQWSSAYRDVVLKSTAAKERLLADAQYFDSRISKIDGAGDLGQEIVKVVQAKMVAETAVPAPPTMQETTNGQKEPDNSAQEQPSTEAKGDDKKEETKS